MTFLDITLPTPAENLACDEALLDLCEAGSHGEFLRFWEPRTVFVVLGYANRAAQEVDLEACKAEEVPVLRRISGGGAVLQAPGCLNYCLVLRTDNRLELESITETNAFVLERTRAVLERLTGEPVARVGLTDLAIRDRKISGNAQRRRIRAVLFHGSFLIRAPVELMNKYLRMPTRAPEYRAGRMHHEFVTSIDVDPGLIKQELRRAWNAEEACHEWPRAETEALVRTKYSLDAWNFKF